MNLVERIALIQAQGVVERHQRTWQAEYQNGWEQDQDTYITKRPYLRNDSDLEYPPL